MSKIDLCKQGMSPFEYNTYLHHCVEKENYILNSKCTNMSYNLINRGE